ncbi:PaaI family thioesterase [Spongiibacter sp.]|uniref:PaaI family thioesterase n=1 Tax=Spongiibacter sp. TaxID=2024860 RepID=UPI003561579A
MKHPFAELIGLEVTQMRAGYSECVLQICDEQHHNPNGVVHGAVLYALADTGMGAALQPSLGEDQYCATVEIKMNYFRPASAGRLHCITEVVNRGRRLANIESRLYSGDALIAQANGNYAILAKP